MLEAMEEERAQDADPPELLVLALDEPGDSLSSTEVPQVQYHPS